ncbi:SufD family Fe-S cluster assembly protein [Alphaproteobacteria bacterium]|nr:SufD family Fe-S cluster assembly protein [Alphaproteobacteria bacterium]
MKEYINKLKTGDFPNEKKWLDQNAILETIYEEIPDSGTEEWKNFKTNSIKETSWKVLLENSIKKDYIKQEQRKLPNSIFFIDGHYSQEASSLKKESGINISSLSDYINKNPEFKSILFNNPSDYAESRLSGIKDKKPTYFILLNSLLSFGTVIEVEKATNINETINIIHGFSNIEPEIVINPYIIIVCKEGSKASFQEISHDVESWNNTLKEIFIRKDANITFSSLQERITTGIKTSSTNCHIDENAELNLKVLNRERSKEDIRIFLNKENSTANISGIILSNNKDESDVFCKVTHIGRTSKSDQNWRLISAKNSKTAINGKICVNKNAKGSDASFYSKSLLLNRKATSFSKPELEILEDDVKCKHGASFGEIDNNSIFYMQSRGIKKKDAIILLIHAFINEIGLDIEDNSELSKNLIDEFFNQIYEK